ncbi:MAG: arsenic efflux protein [Prolixibacteraceae bacterium]|nr:arsenic efflux protein [Prolixibacteraceae bacterium]
MTEAFISTLKQTLMITAFVLFMMVVIEYINVQSRNVWAEKLQKSPFLQIIVAALLGITPGCMGAFTVVSLYTHRMMGLAGLVAVMIATSGDEAFVMFALFPGKALLLNGILLAIAITAGWVVQLFERKRTIDNIHGFEIHHEDICRCFDKKIVFPQLKKITFERSLLLIIAFIFALMLATSVLGPIEWNWKKFTFLFGALFLIFLFFTVPNHFLKEHLYNHIMKKHLLRIFLWTWGAFLILHFVESNLTLNNLLQNNLNTVLLISVLIGIIPESGPHLMIVTLFSQNLVPFSILLANSIVQDGHGMLPLLAESRKDFLKVKIINMVVGLLVGYILLKFKL